MYNRNIEIKEVRDKDMELLIEWLLFIGFIGGGLCLCCLIMGFILVMMM